MYGHLFRGKSGVQFVEDYSVILNSCAISDGRAKNSVPTTVGTNPRMIDMSPTYQCGPAVSWILSGHWLYKLIVIDPLMNSRIAVSIQATTTSTTPIFILVHVATTYITDAKRPTAINTTHHCGICTHVLDGLS